MKLKSAQNNAFNHTSFLNKNNEKVEAKLSGRNYGGSSCTSQEDGFVIRNPNANHCAFFMQSFNRENLQYKVEYKESNQQALEKICRYIKEKYRNKPGIVYCISRNECETVAQSLKDNGIDAKPYHAGMNDTDRAKTQEGWSSGEGCKVVCATIAFGMGIDKALVK